jgi:ribosome-binding factor A
MTRRTERLAEEIREEVASIIARRLKDPRIGFVTVTRVELADDLRDAKVMVGILGGPAERQKSLEGLRKAAGFVRREVGRSIRMRHVPELVFHFDIGMEATDRVARLLQEVERSDAAARSAAEPEDEGEE